eukprot:TRINITY_DN23351_c0_g1_i1.p1 TRINITY_DN23351_c0_g1~~TRINITY_DN23351_c0_g1_i1.p1  ORF type:complete len:299 (-),score=37.02 TRINITY_DN23351_c0_g1_i1:180-1076(-)
MAAADAAIDVPGGSGPHHGVSSVSMAGRFALVMGACSLDQLISYPVWISAKRFGAGMPWPRSIAESYKGAGLILAAYVPTVCVEDGVANLISPVLRRIAPGLGHEGEELASSVCAGAIAGAFVAAPTENLVTRAHSLEQSVARVTRETLQREGLRGICLPYGMLACVGREVPFCVGIFFLRNRIVKQFHDWCGHDLSEESRNDDATKRSLPSLRWFGAELAGSLASSSVLNVVSHPPSVVLAMQQAHGMPIRDAMARIYSLGFFRGFYAGYALRTIAIGGSMFILPTCLRVGGAYLQE